MLVTIITSATGRRDSVVAGAATRLVSLIHFSAIHWTLQSDKEQGRTLADLSSGSNPLNTPEAKKLIDRVCGQIVHPTIDDMMNKLILMD